MGNKVALACSANLRQVLDDVHAQRDLGFAQFQVLRDAADARLDALIRHHPGNPDLSLFQQAAQRTAQSLQVACLGLRSQQLDTVEKQQVREAFEYQLAYLQACLQRSFEQY
jgi:hypothetical protein